MKFFAKLFSICIYALLFLAGCSAIAPSDDPLAQRRQAAQRYLEIVPVSQLVDDTLRAAASRQQSDKNARLLRELRTEVRYDSIEKAALEAMVNIYTIEELEALTRFYGSPTGRSFLSKSDQYLAALSAKDKAEAQKMLAKSFTKTELSELSAFYKSPLGDSVLKKLPDYSRAVSPVVREEIKRAAQKVSKN